MSKIEKLIKMVIEPLKAKENSEILSKDNIDKIFNESVIRKIFTWN